MKTTYLALFAFFCFSSHLIYQPNLFTALCVGFSVIFVCFCEYLEYMSVKKLTEDEYTKIQDDYKKVSDQIENLKSELAGLKISNGFRRQR